MRLWHYKLIPVLPNKMLVSQWRECIAIKRQWEKGTLKHKLVNYVTHYNKNNFLYYVDLVLEELHKRNIKYNFDLYNEIYNFCKVPVKDDILLIAYPEHNDRYLNQCYYNLQEKYDKGIISEEEWQKIKDNININYLNTRK